MEETLLKLSVSTVCCLLAAACCRAQGAASKPKKERKESRPDRISVSSASQISSASSASDVVSVQSGSGELEPVNLQIDDDSEGDAGSINRRRLLTDSPACASSIRFSTAGISVHVQGIQSYRKKNISISNVVALHLAGSLPLADARVLKGGRLRRVGDDSRTALCRLTLLEGRTIPQNSQSSQSRGLGRLLVCDSVFFNFAAEQWQPISRLGVYMSPRHTLYCAFVPTDDLLFIKVGYRAMSEKRAESILPYIEHKTKRLRITNVAGAGVFLMPLPRSHEAFDDPARAAEESLKSAIRCSKVLQASPSGCNMEFVTFSTSLEYFLVKSKESKESKEGSAGSAGSALQALTQTLRDFSGDQGLLPLRAVATPPSKQHGRSGKRRLVAWSEQSAQPTQSAQSARPPPATPVAGLARPSSVRSRQFISQMASARGPFARRQSRRWRDLSFPRAKKRRKAKSCP
ncbi:unnamed protein product [Symbiodinium natans]|uniref:Uncharacterized protein n=1 Tax=Symbiodinium natans TaxID=878477 RepID=A0A812SXT9_9DINO|nr:unnamed protein product [Symbiodinium natans]